MFGKKFKKFFDTKAIDSFIDRLDDLNEPARVRRAEELMFGRKRKGRFL